MSEYDPHAVRAAAQSALDDAIEREGIAADVVPDGDSCFVEMHTTPYGVDAIEAAMIKLLVSHGITKRKPV
jgi:hypothetical protein